MNERLAISLLNEAMRRPTLGCFGSDFVQPWLAPREPTVFQLTLVGKGRKVPIADIRSGTRLGGIRMPAVSLEAAKQAIKIINGESRLNNSTPLLGSWLGDGSPKATKHSDT
jgi:hypothetical protein